jgi:hypothetical protein
VVVATGLVVTAKVAVVPLAGTVTLDGTCAAVGLLLESETTAPPDGAGPFRVTVPAEEMPPITEVGFSVTEFSVAAVTVRVAVWVVAYVAEIVDEALAATGVVVTVKVAVVAFGATVTLAGTCADAGLLLDKATTTPPWGAGAFSVRVPVETFPPRTDDGLTTSEVTVNEEPKFTAEALEPLMVMAWLVGLKA